MKNLNSCRHFFDHARRLLFLSCLLLSATLGYSQTITIAGTIETEVETAVEGVRVQLSGASSDFTFTNASGAYSFEVEAGQDYTITPIYNWDYLNGVSTFDGVLLEQHLLGITILDSPYKLIAADLTGNNAITTLDILTMRDGIMAAGNNLAPFPAGSWRFINAEYEFSNVENPWTDPFPESISFSAVSSNVEANFIGVKIGDLNLSAVSNLNEFNSGVIVGKVFNDLSNDCQYNDEELGLNGWIIQLSGENDYFTTSSFDGSFQFSVPEGEYTITTSAPNPFWQLCPTTTLSVDALSVMNLDLAAQTPLNIPIMEIDISTPVIRRCEEGYYNIQYCNVGTTEAEDAYIELIVDPFLTVTSSSLDWSAQDGNTFTFDLGDVPEGTCGSFRVDFLNSCESVLGQAHCTTALIYPDSIPVLPLDWDGSSLRVTAECLEDVVEFEVENTGSNMVDSTKYIVIEDDLIMHTGKLKLEAGGRMTIPTEANGATKRIVVDQPEGHPGASRPTVAIEGCGENSIGGFSLGFVTQFPQDEGDVFRAIDCTQNVGSYDPNDKQGFPVGVTENHNIEENQPIEYLIRFQNTGTDFARDVYIKDTIDIAVLDITSVRPGASSHDYEFSISNQGILTFLFEDIMLLDSFSNEPESHGYVKFKINQIADLPKDTEIENKAAIYFDFNPPIITNTTWHTVGLPEEIISTVYTPFSRESEIKVFPNPAQSSFLVVVEDMVLNNGVVELYSTDGTLVKRSVITSVQPEISVEGLPKGMYFFTLKDQGQIKGKGRVILQ